MHRAWHCRQMSPLECRKPETVSKSLRGASNKTIEFYNVLFKRESTFFIKNGEVEEKKAFVKIVKMQPGGSEIVLLEI